MARIKEKIRLIKEHPYFRCKFSMIMFFSSMLLNIVLWLLLYFKVTPSQFPIPLHYSIYFGIDNIDYWYKVFVIPLIGICFISLNFIFCVLFYRKEKFISFFLGANNFCLQAVLLGSVIPTILLQNS